MQDAWIVDQQSVGTWANIGYKAPVSKNFDYTETGNWQAVATFDISDCGSTDPWTVTVTLNTDNSVAYQASNNCPTLTPNFKNIGTSN